MKSGVTVRFERDHEQEEYLKSMARMLGKDLCEYTHIDGTVHIHIIAEDGTVGDCFRLHEFTRADWLYSDIKKSITGGPL